MSARYVQLNGVIGWALWVLLLVLPIAVFSFALGAGILWLLYRRLKQFVNERGYLLRNSALFANAIAASVFSVWSLGLLWETIFYADGTGVMALPLIAIGGVPLAVCAFLLSWSALVLLFLALQRLGVGKAVADEQLRSDSSAEDTVCTVMAIVILGIAAIFSYMSYGMSKEREELSKAIEAIQFGATGSEVLKLYDKLENRNEYSDLLAQLATNEALPPGILVSLLKHADSRVVTAAIQNPSLPFASLETIYQVGKFPQQVASNRRARQEWLLNLSRHTDSVVRESVASNPVTPYESILVLSRDSSCGVQVNAKNSLKDRGYSAPLSFFRTHENCKWN